MTRAWKAALVALAVASLAVTGLAAAAPGAAVAAPRAAAAGVPWHDVGPGWVLDEYTVAAPPRHPGPVELYLFSPQGTRYRLASWPDSSTAPQLVAWSPDGTRALFTTASTDPRAEQLTLATGKATTFAVPPGTVPFGYTLPRGLGILASSSGRYNTSYYAFSQDGALVNRLGSYRNSAGILFSPDGGEFAADSRTGLQLVSSSGVVRRQLPVPGTVSYLCGPIRWWNGVTILAACYPPPGPDITGSQLWLVPVSGARPTALTPAQEPTFIGVGAWQLSGDLYVDYYLEHGGGFCVQVRYSGGCGPVDVPGLTRAADAQALTAAGSWLLVVAPYSGFATSTGQLLWFDPATRAERWLTRVPNNEYGNSNAIPFYSRYS